MSVPVEKFAPTAITVAAVAWCCWPYVNEPTSRIGGEEGRLPEITEKMLSPAINPVCRRDPFEPTYPAGMAPEEDETPAEPQGNAIKTTDSVKETSRAESPPPRPIYATPTLPTGPAPEVLIARVLRQITLDATYIRGDRRVAVINGRIFREGDVLAHCGSSQQPCTVQRVFRDRVRIQYRGRNTEVGYRGPSDAKTDRQDHE